MPYIPYIYIYILLTSNGSIMIPPLILFYVCLLTQGLILNSVLFDIDIEIFFLNFLFYYTFILWRRVRHTNYIWSPL